VHSILLACLATYLLASYPHKYVFLVGILPAFIVYSIRRHVPEPAEWQNARDSQEQMPGVADLFVGPIRRITLFTIGVCGVLIADKLGVTQPTISEHLKILSQAGLLTSKRVKQWTFYKRDEARISRIKRAIIARI